jgi:beta-mannosidase
MEHHQKNERGNTIIISTLSRYFRFPENFEHFLYLSQVQQAMAMKTAVEYWRSQRPVCMGALYWQLNDVWPVASWSSIEYGGKWKLLHYLAKRFFQPVHLLAFIKEDKLELWGVNDGEVPVQGTFRARFMDFQGSTLVEEKAEGTLEAEAATRLWAVALNQLSFASDQAFFTASFQAGELQLSNETFLTQPKRCDLAAATIDVQIESGFDSGGSGEEGRKEAFRVTLRSDRPAFYVSLDSGAVSGVFSDNCFTLLPGEKRQILFTPRQELTMDQFRREMSLYHLRGTYR